MFAPPISDWTLERALGRVRDPFYVVEPRGGGPVEYRLGRAGSFSPPDEGRVTAFLPHCPIESLGDPEFCADHLLRFPCLAGAMANGIASVEIVEEMGRVGMVGIFGAAGLPLHRVEAALTRLQRPSLGAIPYGFNLIHSPNEPGLENAVADLYHERGVRLVEASAYLGLTPAVVGYRVRGLRLGEGGRVEPVNRVIAKVSRVEVATRFLSPPPPKIVAELVASGKVSPQQAEWAKRVPMADDVTAEADSGGHTDNQPAVVLLPTMIALRDRIQAEHRYDRVPRIGAAGGISTPWSAAAAFAMGAAYVVTGSVNQSCVESGTSDTVRTMLAQAQQADIAMAPAADMFEMGVKVQVLKRGTLFAMRGAKLYEIYRTHASLEDIPAADRASLEKTIFRLPLETVWEQTQAFFRERDPSQLERAGRDPKHKMALVFRWYLGRASAWANAGDPTRAADYQVWCGPAMAAFNDWVRGSFLEKPENRRVSNVALNILYGAAVLSRARCLAGQGVSLPPGVPRLEPLEPAELSARAGL